MKQVLSILKHASKTDKFFLILFAVTCAVNALILALTPSWDSLLNLLGVLGVTAIIAEAAYCRILANWFRKIALLGLAANNGNKAASAALHQADHYATLTKNK